MPTKLQAGSTTALCRTCARTPTCASWTIDAKVAVVASKTVVALTELNTTAEAVKRKLSCADVGRLGLAMKVWEPTPDVVPELDTNILDGGLGHAL